MNKKKKKTENLENAGNFEGWGPDMIVYNRKLFICEHCIVWKKWDRENESSQKKISYEEKKPLRENISLFTWKKLCLKDFVF